ncbi:MAG: ribonuclease HII [Bdellovibrionaceae bacterium]|nr:ribonuclease HII [Pseudobdellovibrionaceae bacterium]
MTQASQLAWMDLPYDYIIGVDEVGRGCLAGPVVAGSVVFSADQSHWSLFKDSKTLSEIKRNELSLQIQKDYQHSLGWCDQSEIDQINILKASLLAMKRAVEKLNLPLAASKIVLVDGNQFIPNLDGYDQIAAVKGDMWISLISAASIVAKVHRDHLMKEYESLYPGFGFCEHKGYPTEGHKNAIAKLGVTSIHRKSFKGVREYVL